MFDYMEQIKYLGWAQVHTATRNSLYFLSVNKSAVSIKLRRLTEWAERQSRDPRGERLNVANSISYQLLHCCQFLWFT